MTQAPIRLLLVGASGAVGHEVLIAALADARIGKVIAPTRRPLTPHSKLQNPVVNFEHLPESANWWRADIVICTLGSTIKAAGSQAAFAIIDRDLPIQIGRLARQQGANCYTLNSALGARMGRNFYLRTKAEAEAGILALDYPSTIIVRPSLIEATREKKRNGEVLGVAVGRYLKPLIPRRYRPVKAEHIAHTMLEASLAAQLTPTGKRIIESENLHG